MQISIEMHNWVLVGDGFVSTSRDREYEEYAPGHWHDRAMRGPWVIRHSDNDGWLMYVLRGARALPALCRQGHQDGRGP
jgi:beta-fructofuranosidase